MHNTIKELRENGGRIRRTLGEPGVATPQRATTIPRIAKRTKTGCIHLRGETGKVELVHCKTCQGNVRKKIPIHVCTYHGSCLPSVAATADTERMRCAKCRAAGLGFEAEGRIPYAPRQIP